MKRNIFILLYILFLLPIDSFSQCTPNNTFGCTSLDWISNVTFAGINRTSTCDPGVGGYSSYTTPSATVIQGQSYPLSISTGGDVEGAGVWIDYNHNLIYEASEAVFLPAFANTNPATYATTITIPLNTFVGVTGVRVRCRFNSALAAGDNNPCVNYAFGETEDYLVNILPSGPCDPAVTFISQPNGNCFSANQIMSVRLKNFGSNAINLSTNPITLNLNINGPNGLTTITRVITPPLFPTTLGGLGLDSISVLFSGAFAANLYAGGTYSINTSLSIAPPLVNAIIQDDSLSSPIVLFNARPTQGPTYNLCQYASVPFGQGLTVSGCATPIKDSVTLNFTILGPCTDNIGATGNGTSVGQPSNCSNEFACQFASAIIPALPPGSNFYQPAILTVSNLATIGASFASEVRMNLYGLAPVFPTLYSPGTAGATGGTNSQFTYTRSVPTADMSAIYSGLPPLGTLSVGYWESFQDIVAGTDVNINAGASTVVTLKFYYQYVPPSFEWYDVPTGGTSLYSLTPFNPLSVTNTVVNNANIPGDYVFYAACVGSSNCRIPDTLRIKPTPAVFQDTLASCENLVASNTAIFDLTTLNNSVSGGFAIDSVNYFYDQALVSQITPSNSDTSGSIIIYSKVNLGSCYSSDTVVLEVNSAPFIGLNFSNVVICLPATKDIVDFINPFSTVPFGSDTLYYQDAACTQPFVNPHQLSATDSMYIVIKTNTNPYCSDTVGVYFEASNASSNLIVNQVSNISACSITDPISTAYATYTDGQFQNVFNAVDCKKIVGITDLTNGIALGTVAVNETIECPTPYYNTQPYLNRHFQITPNTQDSAEVCLYVLEEDIAQYNFDVQGSGWPLFTNNLSNLCVSKIDNGDILDPAHIVTVIPSSDITVTLDTPNTVYSICFKVDSFSYFYCHTCNPFGAALPVTWKRFAGRRVDDFSELNWITSQEKNNDYFVVERSRDGKNFYPLSNKIYSKGNNGNSEMELSYHYDDRVPYEGHNYYRIQQFDKDGKNSFSKTVDVYFGTETKINVFPNPVTGELNLDILVAKGTQAHMKLMDATGRVVKQMDLALIPGNNLYKLNVDDLADGMYLLDISNNKGLSFTQTIRKN